MELDYSEHDRFWPRREQTIRNVLTKCGGRFLLACKNCYEVEPRVVAEFHPHRSVTNCGCCEGTSVIFLHESTTEDENGRKFYEYQIIRERLSDHSLANTYCKHQSFCDSGERCKYVHTYNEMLVWRMESVNKSARASRKNLARYFGEYIGQKFHCPYCCMNFEDNLKSHLKDKFHLHMQRHANGHIPKDGTWKYKPCRTTLPQRCSTNENDCDCENAHSEKELLEWKMRKLVADARNSFVEETPTVDYLTRLQDRMQKDNLKEIKNSSDAKIIEMEKKEVSWRFTSQLHNSLKGKLQCVSFLQPAFMLRHNGGDFCQHLTVSDIYLEKVDMEIQFKNPGIFGQYTGTLLFDFGDDTALFATNFNVAIRGEGHIDQTCHLEILNQNWSTNRIVIPYPDETTEEVQYEENVKELEKIYKIPRVESLDDVYLEDLNPANYAKQMHNFLYKEELARQALLSRLNIECELKVSEHIFIQSGAFIGSRNDGSLYAAFRSPMRLSIDSDEGVLIRDSCSKVLIGRKEESALAYECEIVQWENNDVYLCIPLRCIKDLRLQKDQTVILVVHYKLNRSKFCQRHFAIDSLQERINLICPVPQMYAMLEDSSVHSQFLDETQNSVLRQIQAEKVQRRHGRGAKCYPPLVVAGPFGTGKTHTIRNVILEILKQNGTDSRILLCTHSNNAADLYIKDIVHDHLWEPWIDKILRVMYHRRHPATVLVQEVKDFCLFSDDKTTFRYPTLSELRKYRIVITTFSTSLALGQLGAGLRTGAFTCIFLDEASQAMEPEVIMPLSLANCETTRIIIAGDHRQINERMFLSDNVKIPTLLERMYNAYNENYRQHRILLCNNYRCVDGLLQLISKLFYKENILKSTGDVELVRGYDPVRFVHVQGECKETDAGDFINVSEAYQVVSEVKELIKLVDPNDIMVTTPHRSQVQLIRDLLKRNRLRSITVYAARNVQALQFRVVILSSVLRRIACLRSGGKNWGFLSDMNLLNTVLTRAKSLVIAVGDTVTLCSTGSCAKKWETFLEHCERSGTIHPEHVNVQMIKSEVRLARQNLRIEAEEFVPSSQLNILTAAPQNPPGACALWAADSPPEMLQVQRKKIVDDPILDDMWLKSNGQLPVETNDRGHQVMEYGLHLEDADPNEIDLNPSEKYAGKEVIFPKHSVGELEAMLEEQPDLYKRCRLHIKSWYSAEAVPVASSDAQNSNSIIHLVSKSDLGRTFDQDEVVVKILKKEEKRTEWKFYGQVMGILKRHQNPKQRYFMCQPDEMNSGIMSPIEKSCTKFAIKTLKDERIKKTGMISVYKIDYTRASFVGLKLVSCDKVDWGCAYAVRYLRWAEYHPYPFGYVAEVVSLKDQRRCRELEFGLSDHSKQSVVSQVQKTEVPISNTSDVIEVFTIDPEGAKDLDDALSLQDCGEHKNCFLFGVHVTDVATVLPKDSPVDLEARKQGGTFYGSHEIDHMLPVELSTRKCSLLRGQTRPTISTFFHTTIRPPHITGRDGHNMPKKCFVRSAKRMTYKEAECIIARTQTSGTGLDAKIKKVWETLWDWRVARLGGAAYFKDFDNYKELLEEGRAHLLIEEAMLAFNANTANYLVSKGFNIHLRVQPLPHLELWEKWLFSNYRSIANSSYLTANSDFIRGKHERLRLFTRTLDGYEGIQIPPKVSEMAVNRLDDNYNMTNLTHEMKRCIRSSSVKDWVELYAPVWDDISERIRSGDIEIVLFMIGMDFLHPSQVSALDQYHSIQNRSEWVTRSSGDTLHSSLRLLRYTKCTSPIRRYPDIVIQRCIHRAIEGKRPTVDTGQVHWDIDGRIRKMKYKFEVAELAKNLKEQPSVVVVCLSLITDAGVKLCFPLQGDCIPPKARELDYAHLMVDLKERDMLEGRNEQDIRRNHVGDIILDQIRASWKFRFYDYARHLNENATKLAPKSDTEENLTVRIPRKQWKAIIDTMTAVTEQSGSKKARIHRRNKLKSALNELSCEPQISSRWDQMCGETRNNPIPVKHHREIKKNLVPGSVIQIQLFSWLGKNRLAEPCVQLLKLAPDMDVCIHHNREPLHIFAHDAKPKDNKPASLKKYRKTWEPLIRLDSAFTAVTDGSSIVIKGIKISWNIVRDVDTNDHEASASSQILDHGFKMEAAFCQERYISFNINDLLCLRLSGVPNISDTSFTLLDRKHPVYTIVLHGAVTSVEGGKKKKQSSQRSGKIDVKFKLFDMHAGNTDVFWNEENQWTVEVIPVSFMHRHLQSSLRKLTKTKNELVGNIALKRVEMERIWIPDDARVLLLRGNLPGFPFPLNDNQRRERNRSMQNKFTLIQGPPGTGKSYLGAHIAATFSLINKTRDPKSPKKVLYCGPSNKAVDVAARFLQDSQNGKVVRMYSSSLEEKIYPNPLKPKPVLQSPGEDTKMPDAELDSIALHKMIRKRTNNRSEAIRKFDADVRDPTKRFTRKQVDSYKAMIRKAKIEELKNCDIIVCTCSLSTLLYDLKDEADEMMEFAQCIIDECGMCSEPETMLPIIVANPKQVVLIGDHKQLQPVVKCKKAERLGLGESLFSNYSNMAGMLEVQYRMDPVIMEYPSNAFYDGRLSCDVSVKRRKEVTFFQHSTKNNVFWNVKGTEKQQKFRSIRGGHKSKYNMEEAGVVIKLLVYLTSSAKLKPGNIMVLSPYTAQCTRIQGLINKERSQLKDVHVGTIVTSQGSEADFVILSTVRSMLDEDIQDDPSPVWKQKHLGFVCDPHQINVGLTRARRGLCIIGNKNLLQVDELWKELIESYEARGAIDAVSTQTNTENEGHFLNRNEVDGGRIWHDIHEEEEGDEEDEDSDDHFSLETDDL